MFSSILYRILTQFIKTILGRSVFGSMTRRPPYCILPPLKSSVICSSPSSAETREQHDLKLFVPVFFTYTVDKKLFGQWNFLFCLNYLTLTIQRVDNNLKNTTYLSITLYIHNIILYFTYIGVNKLRKCWSNYYVFFIIHIYRISFLLWCFCRSNNIYLLLTALLNH